MKVQKGAPPIEKKDLSTTHTETDKTSLGKQCENTTSKQMNDWIK